jgi:hypothetical protein
MTEARISASVNDLNQLGVVTETGVVQQHAEQAAGDPCLVHFRGLLGSELGLTVLQSGN